MNTVQTIQFYNQQIITVKQDDVVYTAMKPICDNIGLQWEAQRQRISRDEVLDSVACMIKATGNDGKNYEMLCLPIDYLNGWLFGVDVKRVKPEIKDKLIQYKKECYQVLSDYWRKGTAAQNTDVNQKVVVNDYATPNLFLSIYAAHEFDTRLKSLFDLAEIIYKRYDDDVVQLFRNQAKSMNKFIVKAQSRHKLTAAS